MMNFKVRFFYYLQIEWESEKSILHGKHYNIYLSPPDVSIMLNILGKSHIKKTM